MDRPIFPHYETLEKIGEGGMGVVWKARDTKLYRFAAIKALPPGKMASEEPRHRFIDEARAASALNHPNIITIYEIGDNYIAMEFVDGKTLAQQLAARRLPLREALDLAAQIAEGLSAAHAAGIVHHDVKPGNIIIDPEGRVKILDFGLAKLTERSPLENEATRTLLKTEQGVIAGTVAYMSPEQAEGKKVDARSDVFAFGIVLYEMLTGKRPFEGETTISTLSSILKDEPRPPHELKPDLPRELERIVSRLLRKEPARRFQNLADVAHLLRDLETDLEKGRPGEAPVAREKSSFKPFAAMVLGAALAAAGAKFLAPRAPEHPTSFTVRPLTSYRGSETDPALSPDGNQIAFTWNGEREDNYDVYVRLVDGGSAIRLTRDPAREDGPSWSPDGQRIAFVRHGSDFDTIGLISALGGVERKLAQLPARQLQPHTSWSADGKYLAFSRFGSNGETSEIWLAATDSGELKKLSEPPAGWRGDTQPEFSPDGHRLAWVRARDLYSRSMQVQDFENGAVRGSPRQVGGIHNNAGMAWLADGSGLVFSDGMGTIQKLLRIPLSGGVPGYIPVDSDKPRNPTIARRGGRLAFEKNERDTDIYRVPGPGTTGPVRQAEATVVVSTTEPDREMQISADGSRIVFSTLRRGIPELWIARADGSEQAPIVTRGGLSVGSPRWSPDGQKIAFDSYENGHSDIWIANAEGGGMRKLTLETSSEIRPSFSADGRFVYFTSNRTGRNEIFRVPAEGGAAVQVTKNGGIEPFESSDGKYLYFSKNSDVWRVGVKGGAEEQISPRAGLSLTAVYAVAGNSIYLTRPGGVTVMRLDSRREFDLFRLPSGLSYSSGTPISVSRDEKWVYLSLQTKPSSDLALVDGFK